MKVVIRYYTAFLLVFTLFLTSCNTSQVLLENGDYDEAIEYAMKRLKGKRKKKIEYVQLLETAFEEATERDMSAIRRLESENRARNWDKILRICDDIRYRQEKIAPLLPLIDQEGIKADFKFMDVIPIENNARLKAAANLYAIGLDKLDEARANGNKYAARKAYHAFKDIYQYMDQYENHPALMKEAKNMAITRVAFEVKNSSISLMPMGMKEILTSDVNAMEGTWQEFYTQVPEGMTMDYNVVINFTHVDIGSERILEREYRESREVQDGWDYVLDEYGNVAKDTLGNDIKVERFIMVHAWVLETLKQKDAGLRAQLEIYDAHTQQRLDVKPISIETFFENIMIHVDGDKRALSNETKRKMRNAIPLPFPRDEELLRQAIEELKPLVRQKMNQSQVII